MVGNRAKLEDPVGRLRRPDSPSHFDANIDEKKAATRLSYDFGECKKE